MAHATLLFATGLCERRAGFVATVQQLLAEAEGGGGCVPAGISIKLLLEPELPGENGSLDGGATSSTPLHDAAGYGDTDKVAHLLGTTEGCAMVDVQDSVS